MDTLYNYCLCIQIRLMLRLHYVHHTLFRDKVIKTVSNSHRKWHSAKRKNKCENGQYQKHIPTFVPACCNPYTTSLYSKNMRRHNELGYGFFRLPLPGLPWGIMEQAFPCESSSWRTRRNLKLPKCRRTIMGITYKILTATYGVQ